ncbi:unnamed protein product, partial [Polarella glacialis]
MGRDPIGDAVQAGLCVHTILEHSEADLHRVPTTVAAEIFHTEGSYCTFVALWNCEFVPHAILDQDCMGVSHGILNLAGPFCGKVPPPGRGRCRAPNRSHGKGSHRGCSTSPHGEIGHGKDLNRACVRSATRCVAAARRVQLLELLHSDANWSDAISRLGRDDPWHKKHGFAFAPLCVPLEVFQMDLRSSPDRLQPTGSSPDRLQMQPTGSSSTGWLAFWDEAAECRRILNAMSAMCWLAREMSRPGRKLFGRTLISVFQQELNELCTTLEARQCRHVRCLRPNDEQKPLIFDDVSMLRQCRYSGLLEATRIRKMGYAHRRPLRAFAARYAVLLTDREAKRSARNVHADLAAQACGTICQVATTRGVDTEDVRIGLTKVFLRESALNWLEAARSNMAASVITALMKGSVTRLAFRRSCAAVVRMQAFARGCAARKETVELRLRLKAARVRAAAE